MMKIEQRNRSEISCETEKTPTEYFQLLCHAHECVEGQENVKAMMFSSTSEA
jgi:hypothetical protein